MTGPVNALLAYRDDGPLAELVAALSNRLAGSRDRPDPALLTLAGVLPVGLLAARPNRRPGPALGAGVGWLLICAGTGAGRPLQNRLSWLVPPLLRAAEYGLLLRFSRLAAGPVGPTYGLLSVLAFHHYDVVYRVRARGVAPPRWLRLAGGGWDLRVLGCYVLLITGRWIPGVPAAAGVLGGLFVSESVRSWLPGNESGVRQAGDRHGRPHPPALYQDSEADEE